MNKLMIFFGLLGVLTIFFLGMGIQLESKPTEFAMEEIAFSERSNPQIPVTYIVVATPEPAPQQEVVVMEKVTYIGEEDYYADITTSHGKPLLQRTDSGKHVAELQSLLNERGASLDIDGKFGDETRQAVMDFQEANNLDLVDGFAGEETWSALLDIQEDESMQSAADQVFGK